VTNILFVVILAVLCIGSLHRTASPLDIWRHCKYIWLLAVLAAAALQVRRRVRGGRGKKGCEGDGGRRRRKEGGGREDLGGMRSMQSVITQEQA